MKVFKGFLAVLLILTVSSVAWSAGGSDSDEMDGEETVKLTWVIIGDQHADDDMVLEEFNKRLQEKLPNTELEVLVYSFGAYADRIELMITAGEDFDIMWCSNWAGDYLQKVANGAFMPIDDLIDEYGPELKEVLPPLVFETGTYDGKQYGLTNYQQLWVGSGIIARKDWADKYGLDVEKINAMGADRSVETMDLMRTFEPYFANILANEMDSGINSVIDPYYIIEKTVSNNMVIERDYETIVAPAVIDKFNNDNVQLVNMFATDLYKEYIDWMREMYLAGYIRKDVLSAEVLNVIGDERLNTYGLMTSNTGTPDDFTSELNNAKMKTHEVISAHTSPLYLPYTAGTATMNFINAKSENPERAMELIELMNTDKDMYNLLAHGIEGVHWEWNESATNEQSAITLLTDTYTYYDWTLGSVANSYLRSPAFIEARLTKWNNISPKSPLFGFVPDMSELTQDKAKLDAVINEFAKALNSGADRNYEEHYEEFLAKLDAAGVDEFIAALQVQVDAYLGQ